MGAELPLIRRDEPLVAQVDGETVMLHPKKGSYFALGEVGTRIWALLESPRTIDEICAQLVGEFQVEPETCRTEVVKFVTELTEADLVAVAAVS